jgi:hypothetical protein
MTEGEGMMNWRVAAQCTLQMAALLAVVMLATWAVLAVIG